jgi:SAM-dependent methyltransferase/methyltransferase-like protein
MSMVPPASAPPQDLASIVARTSRSYDLLPYTSVAFPRTQPSHLAGIARLFGLDVASVGQARILELGCAAGGNVIPLAARHSGATFVGVDVSPAQIAAGQARLSHLGVSNLTLTCRSITDVGAADGNFDYIICHGVYSWVPAPVREAILRVCRERLSPRGIAVVSYNVLPGWRVMQATRDCLLLDTSGESDPRRRGPRARELLELLVRGCPSDGAYGAALRQGAELLGKMSDDYIVHEFLDETNEPCTFRDFVAAARQHGLGYLADADLSSMIAGNYAEETAKAIGVLGNGRLLATEQMIDTITGRLFRHSILVGSERVNSIDRNLGHERVEGLHFITDRDLSMVVDPGGDGTLANANGMKAAIKAPLMNAITRLIEMFPASASIEELAPALPPAMRDANGRAVLRDAMLRLVLAGLATARAERVPAATMAGAKPFACPLVREDASRGARMTANLRHEHVELDAFAQQVLPLLDGSRDADAVTAVILQRVSDGRLMFSRGNGAGDTPNQPATITPDSVRELFSRFARAALLCDLDK